MELLKERAYSISDLTAHTDVGYEQVRRVVKGLTIPSKSLLRRMCDFLKVDFEELNKIRSRDEIRKKHGLAALRNFPIEEDLATIENAWPTLRQDQKSHLLWMVESFLKEKAVSRSNKIRS